VNGSVPTPPPVRTAGDPASLARAVAALEGGAVVAVPTDTVYGLAAALRRPEALADVFELKGRPAGLALPVLVGDRAQAAALVAALDDPATVAGRLAARFWPGPLTVVVAAPPSLARPLGGDGRTIGVRWPDHPVVAALCAAVGPLAVTSANRHGEPPCTTAEQVVGSFTGAAGPGLALVLNGGRCDGVPSTVVDCTGPRPRVLRVGAVPTDAVEADGPLGP
jgi:tRNA threonylcarbamoyl adenosine modification protein (Sua5/YciO/YrdC/YwlC family)